MQSRIKGRGRGATAGRCSTQSVWARVGFSQNLHDMRHRHLIDPGRWAATLLMYIAPLVIYHLLLS